MMPLELLSWQTTLPLELMAVKLQANATLDVPSEQQLLVWLFAVDQLQETDHSHPLGVAGQQDMPFSWIQCLDECSPPTKQQVVQFLQKLTSTETANP